MSKPDHQNQRLQKRRQADSEIFEARHVGRGVRGHSRAEAYRGRGAARLPERGKVDASFGRQRRETEDSGLSVYDRHAAARRGEGRGRGELRDGRHPRDYRGGERRRGAGTPLFKAYRAVQAPFAPYRRFGLNEVH